MEDTYSQLDFLAGDLAADGDADCLAVSILAALDESNRMLETLPPGPLSGHHRLQYQLAEAAIRQGVAQLLTLGAELAEVAGSTE